MSTHPRLLLGSGVERYAQSCLKVKEYVYLKGTVLEKGSHGARLMLHLRAFFGSVTINKGCNISPNVWRALSTGFDGRARWRLFFFFWSKNDWFTFSRLDTLRPKAASRCLLHGRKSESAVEKGLIYCTSVHPGRRISPPSREFFP